MISTVPIDSIRHNCELDAQYMRELAVDRAEDSLRCPCGGFVSLTESNSGTWTAECLGCHKWEIGETYDSAADAWLNQ